MISLGVYPGVNLATARVARRCPRAPRTGHRSQCRPQRKACGERAYVRSCRTPVA